MRRRERRAEAGAVRFEPVDRDHLDERARRSFLNEAVGPGGLDLERQAAARLAQGRAVMLSPGSGDGDVQLVLADEALAPELDESRQTLRPGQGEDGRTAFVVDRQLQAFEGGGVSAPRAAII
jgi:hypothetical protein